MRWLVACLAWLRTKGAWASRRLRAQLAIACSRQAHTAHIVDTDPQGTLVQWAALREQLDMEFTDDVNVQHGSAWRLSYIQQRLSQEHDIPFVDGPSGRADDFKAIVEVACGLGLISLPTYGAGPISDEGTLGKPSKPSR